MACRWPLAVWDEQRKYRPSFCHLPLDVLCLNPRALPSISCRDFDMQLNSEGGVACLWPLAFREEQRQYRPSFCYLLFDISCMNPLDPPPYWLFMLIGISG